MAVLFSCFFGDGKKRGWCIISHGNVMNKGNIRLTRSSFWRFVSSRMWRKRCMEQGRCRWVDRPSKEHETFCKYICCEPKERCEKKARGERSNYKPENSMAIYPGMFEIYPCWAIRTHDDLKLPKANFKPFFQKTNPEPKKTYLIIPPIRTCPNLFASLQVVSPA